ncbi:MAG: N-acetyltransferase family protein [Actinomycetes bacterium]
MTTPSTPVADSVRLALPSEAAVIAAIQRRRWVAELPPELSTSALAALTVEEMTEAWHAAITRPPQARFRVLVAVEDGRVVGFATTLPSADADAEEGVDGAVEEFGIDPPAQRRGHGSRLLHAAVDTLRADGFSRATSWVGTGDDVLRAFLVSAGWAPDGGHREIGPEEGQEPDEAVRLKQVRLHTAIG